MFVYRCTAPGCCRYGQRPRNVMDIYLPPNVEFSGSLQQEQAQQPGQNGSPCRSGSTGSNGAAAGNGEGPEAACAAEGAPMVLFCHGGVWAAGSKWHYAPLATRLAQAGVITAVMQAGGPPASPALPGCVLAGRRCVVGGRERAAWS